MTAWSLAGGVPATWEIDDMLDGIRRSQEWRIYYLGDRPAPYTMAMLRAPEVYVGDVIVLRGPDHAAAWRTATGSTLAPEPGDPMNPVMVYWHYLGSARHVLRAMLTLEWDGALPLYRAPAECSVPEISRRPLTIRPPQ